MLAEAVEPERESRARRKGFRALEIRAFDGSPTRSRASRRAHGRAAALRDVTRSC